MNAKLLFGVLGTAAAVFARSQANLAVLVDGKTVGTARFSQRITATHKKLVQIRLQLISDSAKVTVYSESTYSSTGEIESKREDMAIEGDPNKRHLKVTFSPVGAKAVEDVGGKVSVHEAPIGANTSYADLSEFWFIRDQPRIGDTITASAFNVQTYQWELVKTMYRGERPILVDGKRVMAHVTASDKGTAYLDGTGLPLRLEMPGMTMERVWKPAVS